MLRNRRSVLIAGSVVVMFLAGLQAQEQGTDRPPAQPRSAAVSTRQEEAADLGKENMGRVAASSGQLQAVLLKDAGILVELKAWVANEATDSGQIVEDSLLTDQAIFDRLDRDVAFRAVATRLVQRYGYLLPGVNPDSELAKQQDLVLKERAHLMAQRQDQEQAAALRSAEEEKKQFRQGARVESAGCDPRIQSICDEPTSARRPGGTSPGDTTIPDFATPLLPEQTSPPVRFECSAGLRAICQTRTVFPAWTRVSFWLLIRGDLEQAWTPVWVWAPARG